MKKKTLIALITAAVMSTFGGLMQAATLPEQWKALGQLQERKSCRS